MATTPVTRASLITRAAQRANTSGYADTSAGGEVSGLVDTALAKLYNQLVTLYEDYSITRGTPFPLIANQDVYPFPPDLLKLRSVFYLTPSTSAPTDLSRASRTLLSRVDETEDTGTTVSGSYPSLPFGYILEGSNIVIVPRPSTTSNYIQLRYVPTYSPPVNDSQPINFMFALGWDEYVVNDVCLQIRNKANMPSAEIMAERDQIMKNIITQAKNRDATNPPKVRNTGWRYGNGIPSRGQFSFK